VGLVSCEERAFWVIPEKPSPWMTGSAVKIEALPAKRGEEVVDACGREEL
jgi:hypothetical protein